MSWLFLYAYVLEVLLRYNKGMDAKGDAVEDIKARISIEDVASEYVELKRAGRNFKALSPFSSEKTPSLMISPEKQIWHDFSSGKGGNMFSFVMEMESVDFKEALEILARKAGIDLSQYRSGASAERGKQKSRLAEALKMAAKFYQVQFSKNREALDYILKKRDFSKDTALEWQIGYSPNTGHALVDYLRSKKFTDEEIQRAGLASTRYNGLSDMFRGRVMFPLSDARGQIIGFTARILQDEPNAPKYINTPQTPLYDKSRNVYGLHLAKDAIRRHKFAVVAEGNLDVIASHQAGVKNVVASAGTAMTEFHLKELLRFTDDIRLSFDQDNAGLAATERIIPLASKVGANLSIITVPEGKDPDELIRKNSAAWETAIDNYDYAVDWMIKQYEKKLDITTGSGKKAFTDTVLPIVAGLSDHVERDHYIGVISEKIGINKDALISKLASTTQIKAQARKKSFEVAKVTPAEADQTKTQNQLLALCLIRQSLRFNLEPIRAEMLKDEQARAMLRFLQQFPEVDVQKPGEQASALLKLGDYVKMLVILYEELYAPLELLELQYEAARLQVRVIEHFVKAKKTLLIEQLRSADEATTDALLQEVKKLDVLLKTTKEHHHAK